MLLGADGAAIRVLAGSPDSEQLAAVRRGDRQEVRFSPSGCLSAECLVAGADDRAGSAGQDREQLPEIRDGDLRWCPDGVEWLGRSIDPGGA